MPGELDALLAHPVIRRLTRALREHPGARWTRQEEPPVRRAAVALILRAGTDGGVDLLLIERAAYEGDPWSGHIALPGGREESGDASLEETAIRETWEETGIDLSRDGCIIGLLDDVRPRTVALPAIVVSPFVALLGQDPPLVVSPEVAAAFWVPLAALRDPRASGAVELELAAGPRTVQCFRYEDRIIWGITDRILRQFLSYLR